MEIIDIWQAFGQLIHQDFLLDYPDLFSGFVEMFNDFPIAQRKELYCFLVQIVNAGHTPEELADIWGQSGSVIWVETDQMPRLFSDLVSFFEGALRKSGVEIPPCS